MHDALREDALREDALREDALREIVERHGTPCYVYEMDEIARRIAALRGEFGGRFRISYAVKSNPNAAILARLATSVDRLDVSSGGELKRAADWDPSRLSFTGPGKRDDELRLAAAHRIGHVIVESVAEAERLDRIAGALERVQPVLVRICPARLPRGFGVNMSGKPSQFGIDEEDADDALERMRALKFLDVQGFHILSGTQCLHPPSVAENYEIFIEIFRRLANRHQLRPSCLVFGSGLGIPYHENQEALDLHAVAGRINPVLDALKAEPAFAACELVLELGRWLVGPAGRYLTRVVQIKSSRGTRIAICDGGMNHNLAACGHLGSVIHRNYRLSKLGTATGPDALEYDLVGPLCTSIDTLGHRVRLPRLEVGDTIVVENSGAYGFTASPVHFISHPLPKELMVETAGGRRSIVDVSPGPVR